MKQLIRTLCLLLFTSAAVTVASANNITVTNGSLTGKDAASHFTAVQFTVGWENSWRTSSAIFFTEAPTAAAHSPQQTVRTANLPSSAAGTGALVTGNFYRNGEVTL